MEEGKAKISINGEFTAEELEEIIADLAKARAGTSPAVPMQPPTALHQRKILVQEEAAFTFRKLATGGLRVWLRNEGIGWLAFTLSAQHAAGIRELLNKQGLSGHTSH